jgi:hypothetical protein
VSSELATQPKPTSSEEFYRDTMRILQEAEVPYLVGGAYALGAYTGISRDTKDLDFFLRPSDVERALEAFRSQGYHAEMTFPHWLAKVKYSGDCLDLIFRSGNGICEVDDSWFKRARDEEVLGQPVKVTAPEETIWLKCYIMERERFDGADVAHLIHASAERLDWPHLVRRFNSCWRVLLSHLVLFGFIYPSERNRIPASVMSDLLQRAQEEIGIKAPSERVCRGTLLSRAQYLPDVLERGYRDARLEPRSHMTATDIESWTAAIDDSIRPH